VRLSQRRRKEPIDRLIGQALAAGIRQRIMRNLVRVAV
jgi:hypothetical protein